MPLLPDRLAFTTTLLHHAADPFRLLVENVKDYAIYLLDPAGRIASWNTGAERIGGFAPEEVLGQPFDTLYRPEARTADRPRQDLDAALALGKHEAEGLWPRKDGSTFWAISTVTALHENGRHIGFAVVIRDISERKTAEEANRRERDLSDAILNSLPGVYYLYDDSGRFLRWNKNFEAVTGRSPEEIARMHPLDFFAGGEKERVRDRIAEVFREGRSEVEAHLVTKAGDRPPYYFNGVAAEIDGRACLLGMGIDISARVRAEQALGEANARLRRAASAGNVGLWEWDLRTDQHFCSPEWKRQLGHEDDEIGCAPSEWSDRLHPADREGTLRRVEACLAARETSYRAEFRMRHKDGSYRWILSQASVEYEADGRPTRMLGAHVDITDRKEVEEKLSETESRFRAFMEHVPAIAWIIDRDGVFVYANSMLGETIRLRSDEYVGRPLAELFPPESARPFLEANEEVLRTGKPSQAIHPAQRIEGTLGQFLVVRFPLPSPRGVLVGGVSLDVTEQLRTREALRTSEERFRLLIDGIKDYAIYTMDAGGLVATWNDGAARLYRRPANEILGRHHSELFHHDDIAAGTPSRELEIAASAGKSSDEGWRLRKDGSGFWAHVTVSVLRDAADEVQGFVKVVGDLTERRTLEQASLQSQKLEAVGRLAGGVAHDFNNLLTVINGYSEMMCAEVPPESPHRAALEAIQAAGEQASALTRRLLAFSRKQVIEPVVLDLNAVVAQTRGLLSRLIGEHISITATLDPALPRVKVDPGQIEQVLMNLCVNARDAMPSGGRLVVETSTLTLEQGQTLYPDLAVGRYVVLSVADTGCGMDEETQAHLFEPFFTTKCQGKGTGLGLAIVFGIVKQADGHVGVASELGAGTTFTILLPVVEDGPPPAPGRSAKGRAGGAETVLVVEDEAAVRKLARVALGAAGYHVLEATNGLEALGVAARHDGPIHLLLTDVVMPHFGGRQLAETLRALRTGVKVLFMSGYTDDSVILHGVLVHTDKLVHKPFSPLGLVEKVREVLDGLP